MMEIILGFAIGSLTVLPLCWIFAILTWRDERPYGGSLAPLLRMVSLPSVIAASVFFAIALGLRYV